MGSIFDMQQSCPQTMRVLRDGAGTSPVPEGISSGAFTVQMLLSSRTEGEMTAMRAFVPPGIVTHWHSHPRGQLLFVLDGVGRVQRARDNADDDGAEGDDVVELHAGDAVWFAPNERHWHGAAADSSFEYLSVQPVKDGSAVAWFEPVKQESLVK
ncbi:cupin domain-containing protein [Thalassospira sp. TSL5-1]|uniref:cupin domain-containing protein n=1 Tax=Thalassospira sp. TSL5-1 TaxID=1544451 RepID=UPI00093ACD61|nr:cupin domain-containing protein [Thalassospira sp. TSL5-1]OKH87926.1 cupin [Thalassospira sp. TSL5-1]